MYNRAVKGYKTAEQVATEIGLSLETVYYRLRNDKMKGEKINGVWFVADAEVAKAKKKGPLKTGRTLADRKPKEASNDR